MSTILNCPKIKKTEKSFDDLIKILESESLKDSSIKEFDLILEGDKHTPETSFISSTNIQQCYKETKGLQEDNIILKVVLVQKSPTKIFFNDLEYVLNEHFLGKFKCV